MKLGHFDKHFVKSSRKKDPAGNGKFNLRMDTGPSFAKSGHFFDFQRRAGEASPP